MKGTNLLKYNTKKNIALLGHMGSGKTIIGKLIAKKLKLTHLDSDIIIEKNSKKKIKEIFKKEGEKSFRMIEEKTILSLKNKNNIVLSIGGGSILSQKTRNFLKKKFLTVFLDINILNLVDRLSKSTKRPLLEGVNIEKKIKELDTIRRKYYLLADIRLKDYENPQETVTAFLTEYNKTNEKNN